jgi:hypothetical protein
MAGTAFTSGYDVVLQINALTFEGIIQAFLRPRLRLGVLPLAPPSLDPSITFAGPAAEVRCFFARSTGNGFICQLNLPAAQYNADGRSYSLGTGRTTIEVPMAFQQQLAASSRIPPGALPDTQFFDFVMNNQFSALQFRPDDSSALTGSGTDVATLTTMIARALTQLVGSQIVLTAAAPIPVFGPMTTTDPVLRRLDTAFIRGTAARPNEDIVAFGIDLIAPDASNGTITTMRSVVNAVQDGALLVSTAFLFNRIVAAIAAPPPAGLGVPASVFVVNSTSLTLAPGMTATTTIRGVSVLITALTLAATADTLTLTSHYQFALPPGILFDIDVSGPVTFALSATGVLVAGANLTPVVAYSITPAGAIVLGLVAIAAAVITVASYGTASIGVTLVAAGIAATTAAMAVLLIELLIGGIASLIAGPTFQTAVQRAFGGAGAGLPVGLLNFLGGSAAFTPPLLFDDLSVPFTLPGADAVPELHRVSAVSVPYGQVIDLDTATVEPFNDLDTTGDLAWGIGGIPSLDTTRGGRMVRLSQPFESITHEQLQSWVTGASQVVDGSAIPMMLPFGEPPSPLVLGVRTTEHRYAKVAVWRDGFRLLLRYVTFDTLRANVRIHGGDEPWVRVRTVQDPDTPGTPLLEAQHHFRDAYQGAFRAIVHEMVAPIEFNWSLASRRVVGSGVLPLDSGDVGFVVEGDHCQLTTELGMDLDADLLCTASDACGNFVSDRRRLQVSGRRAPRFAQGGLRTEIDSLGQHVFWRSEESEPDPGPIDRVRVGPNATQFLSPDGGLAGLQQSGSVSMITFEDAERSLRDAIAIGGGIDLKDIRLR